MERKLMSSTSLQFSIISAIIISNPLYILHTSFICFPSLLFFLKVWILDLGSCDVWAGWRTMLVVPELEREVELLWQLKDTRKVYKHILQLILCTPLGFLVLLDTWEHNQKEQLIWLCKWRNLMCLCLSDVWNKGRIIEVLVNFV